MKIKKGWDRLALGLALISLLFWPIEAFVIEKATLDLSTGLMLLGFMTVSFLIVFFLFEGLVRLVLWIIEGFKE